MAVPPVARATETIVVETSPVACDGNNGLGLGHPRVYLSFDGERRVTCPYCSRTFELAAGAKTGGH